MTVLEASVEDTQHGRVITSDGWFVLNLGDAFAYENEKIAFSRLESAEHRAVDFGVNVHVLWPGQPNAKYHAESAQEAFLVLSGECVLVIEEEERTLRAWDFVHCPAGTRHVFVGAGDGPCAILMIGARGAGKTIEYPVSEAAARYGASVSVKTSVPSEAYADWSGEFEPVRLRWPLEDGTKS